MECHQNETDDAIARMKEELRSVLPDGKVEKPESQSRPQSGERPASFPYPVGKLVKTAFPELFRRQLLGTGDIAAHGLERRGCPVLRMCAGEDDPGLYTCGHRRYCKMPPLELARKGAAFPVNSIPNKPMRFRNGFSGMD